MSNDGARNDILRRNNAEANAITRESIERALILLMDEKDFADITITDIAKRAGVSRLAYYRNYESKEDILSGFLQGVVDDMYQAFRRYDAITETRQLWFAIFQKVTEHADDMRLLVRAGYSARLLQEYVRAINSTLTGPEDDPGLYYSNCYWVGALHSMTLEWLEHDMTQPIEQMVDIGVAIMQRGISTIDEFGNRR